MSLVLRPDHRMFLSASRASHILAIDELLWRKMEPRQSLFSRETVACLSPSWDDKAGNCGSIPLHSTQPASLLP